MNIEMKSIPQELIERSQWVAWRSKNKENGKISKIPVDPHTGGHAKTTAPSTWGSFDQAVACCQKKGLAGIGFVFSAGDPFVGIDLDDCIDPDTKSLEPWAEQIVSQFASYSEISPSGKGVHILIKGKLPGLGKKSGHLEVYDQGRFFTVTGNILPNVPQEIGSRQDELNAFLREHFDPSPPSDLLSGPGNAIDIDRIIINVSKANIEMFNQLWAGNFKAYPSQSEADLALCRMLSQPCKNDRVTMDSMFRQSGLYRPKWDKQVRGGVTYGQATIDKVLDNPRKDKAPQEGDCPATHKLTDLGNAERLYSMFGDDIRYCHQWEKWLVWNGKMWELDRTMQINSKAKEVVRSIYLEASQAKDSGERTAIAKHAEKSESEARMRSMVNLARSDQRLAVHPEQLDQNHWLLTCTNGTVDLTTGELMSPKRDDLITQLAPVEYNPDATCPTWDTFLDRIMAGNEDLIAFLQRAIGYSLTGTTGEQCLFIFHGSGANGKSTFLQAVSSMLGPHAMQTPTETLLVKRQGAIANDVARLKGARLVTASEAEADQRLAESQIKQMTGQDRMTARFLYQELFEFNTTHKIFLATNHKPVIKGSDPAIWRRIKLVPFEVTIPPQERDRDLLSKLEAERSGILAWAVRGCLDWQENGLGEPAEVKTATLDYQCEMDIMAQYINDCCQVDEAYTVPAQHLYASYQSWCAEVGEEPMKQKSFGAKLREKNFKPSRTRVARIWEGLKLQPVTDIATVTDCHSINQNSSITTAHIEDKDNYVSHPSHQSHPASLPCAEESRLLH
jgi:putative DNA primase/helicase